MNIGAMYRLTKPGVTYGNLITTIAGYLFAADGKINWAVFIALTIGTWFVIASACVINNYLDQDIDILMTRTRERPLLTGEVTGRQAVIFGTTLGIIGTLILSLYTNWWVVGIGVGGWIVYVWLYGALGKRRSVHGTLVGSVSGAAPILAGYAAVSNSIDLTGIILFLIIFFWQMPEFYSISIYRRREYVEAGVPVSGVIRGVARTTRQIFAYTVLTIISLLLLNIDYRTSWTYFLIMLVMSVRWLQIAVEGFINDDSDSWAKSNFHYSLWILIIFSLIISINSYLV